VHSSILSSVEAVHDCSMRQEHHPKLQRTAQNCILPSLSNRPALLRICVAGPLDTTDTTRLSSLRRQKDSSFSSTGPIQEISLSANIGRLKPSGFHIYLLPANNIFVQNDEPYRLPSSSRPIPFTQYEATIRVSHPTSFSDFCIIDSRCEAFVMHSSGRSRIARLVPHRYSISLLPYQRACFVFDAALGWEKGHVFHVMDRFSFLNSAKNVRYEETKDKKDWVV
jgi:hypothetical protein